MEETHWNRLYDKLEQLHGDVSDVKVDVGVVGERIANHADTDTANFARLEVQVSSLQEEISSIKDFALSKQDARKEGIKAGAVVSIIVSLLTATATLITACASLP